MSDTKSVFSRNMGSVAYIALCLGIFFLLCNFLLALSFNEVFKSNPDAYLVSQEQLRSIADRVALVNQEINQTNTPAAKLAVVVGLSTAREGIDPKQFQQDAHGQYRLLNLSASGGSISEMKAYAQPLLSDSLRPDVVILAVHPSWLAGRGTNPRMHEAPRFRTQNLSSESLRGYAKDMRRYIAQHIWVLENRAAIHSEIRKRLMNLRRLVHSLENFSSTYTARNTDTDPWEVQTIYKNDYASSEFLATQLREWEALGWFDAERLTQASLQAAQFRALLLQLSKISPRVILVLMPEASAFYSRVPNVGTETIKRIALDVGQSIEIRDFRQNLAAESFHDHAHVNRFGRQTLTKLIGTVVLTTP